MRIGIDARFLTHPQRGGFKSYTRALVSALTTVDTVNEYILYTDRPGYEGLLPPNFRVKPVTAANFLLREQFALPQAMKRDRVDVAHFPCNTSPVVAPPPMVVTIHDCIALKDTQNRTGRQDRKHLALNAYWRTVIPRSANMARLIVTSTNFSRDDIMETLGHPKEHFRVVNIAVDPVFSPNTPGKPPSGVSGDYVFAFAAADGRKNHGKAIEAFLSNDFPGVKLVLNCSHASLRDQIPKDPRILPVGPVETEELIWLYQHGLALVFPSLDEGFGLPPIEAMSCGLPVVASASGSIPEVLGDCAVYVDARDPASIARGLHQVLGSQEERHALAARGLAHSRHFTRAKMGHDLVSVYAEAAEIGGTGDQDTLSNADMPVSTIERRSDKDL